MIYIEDIEKKEDLLKYVKHDIVCLRFEMNRENILMYIFEDYILSHFVDDDNIYYHTIIYPKNTPFSKLEDSYYEYKYTDIVCEIGKGE